MQFPPLIFITIFFSMVIGLSGIGYFIWTQVLLPKYLFPLFKLKKEQTKNWKRNLAFIIPIFAWLLCWISAPFVINAISSNGPVNNTPPPLNLTALVLFVASSVFLGLTSIPYSGLQVVGRFYEKLRSWKKLDLVLAVLTALAFFGGGFFILNDVISNYNNDQASNFFILNAAIKNTCFMDPKRIGCPHNLTELSYIEPSEFARLSKTSQLIYEYYPDQNVYTFIARYSKNRAIVFDWRFTHEKDSHGIDFKLLEINTWGKDRFKNPPDFPGPWDKLPEWNK